MANSLSQQDILNLLLQYLQIPETSHRTPSFLDIVHRSRDENMLSNVLAYYMRSSNPHGFGSLLANAFLQIVAPQMPQTDHAEVYREYSTAHGRLDLVIRTDAATIGIEHKIDAPLYNDLEDYRRTLIADFGEPVYCVVLSVHGRQTDNPHWLSVTYNRFWQQVRAQLGLCLNSRNLLHLPQLVSLIEHTEQLNMSTELNEKERFLLNHYAQFSQLKVAVSELEDKFWGKAHGVYAQLKNAIENEGTLSKNIECWYYLKKSPQGCFVMEFRKISCACDFRLSCEGVHLSLLSRCADNTHFRALRQYLEFSREDSRRYYLIETPLQDYDWYARDVADDLRRQVFSFLERVCDYIKRSESAV